MTADDVKPFRSAIAADARPKAGVDFAKLIVDKSMLPPAKKKAKSGNNKTMLIAAGGAIAGLLRAGIIVKSRDKDDNEVARIQLLEGGGVGVQQSAVAAGKQPIATTTKPAVSFIPPPMPARNVRIETAVGPFSMPRRTVRFASSFTGAFDFDYS